VSGVPWATRPVPQVLTDSTNAYIYPGSTAPAEQVNLTTGAITYLVADLLGSVRGTVNSSGALTGTTAYDAWGNPLTTGGLTATTPFGFASGYTDPTGVIYLINRYYDPQVGQFISVDPALAQTQQPYAYAGGNPVANVDPTGQAWQFVGWAYGQGGWHGGKVTALLWKLIQRFVGTLQLGVVSIQLAGAEFQARWLLAVWRYYYEGRATPWWAMWARVSWWARAAITVQAGVFIPGTPLQFGFTVWSGWTPAFPLPGTCTGWVYFYNSTLQGGGACGLV
jgi:RHS repeat-associated protein